MRSRFTAGLLAAVLGAGLFGIGARGAQAGSSGRRNFALGLGAVAAYELLRGKTVPGLIAGAGAAYAYKRYRDGRRDERRYDRYGYDRYGYDRSRRYDSTSYRDRRNSDEFQFPDQYSSGGSYQNDGYQSPDGGDYGKSGYQYQNDGDQYQNDGDYGKGSGHSRYGDGQYGSGWSLPRYNGRHRRHSD